MAYTPYHADWKPKPDTSTPISDVALEHMEAGIALAATVEQIMRDPEQIAVGAITRDSNGAATAFAVTWPDGQPGNYTALALSSAFPGAVDSYKITYGAPVQYTYTQPTVTRDAAGAVTNLPAIVVS